MPASNDRDSRAPGSIFKIEFRASQESTVRVIDFLDHGLRRQPEHDCLRDASGTFSHRDVELLTHRVAHALRAAGLETGSRVAFYTPNCALAFVAMIAVFRAGAVWQPVHPRNALTENIDFLNDNGAEYLFYHSHTAADAAEFKTKVASLKGMTCLDLADDNGPSLETWAARYPEIFPEDEHGASDLAWVKATGRTTGQSKSQ